MEYKPLVQALGVVWLLLFAASFVALGVGDADGSETSGLERVVTFLTWQAIAFVVAMLAAFATRVAVGRGVERVKVIGYLPLAISVFLMATFIAILAFRFFVAPLFDAPIFE